MSNPITNLIKDQVNQHHVSKIEQALLNDEYTEDKDAIIGDLIRCVNEKNMMKPKL